MDKNRVGTLTFKWDYNYLVGAAMIFATGILIIAGINVLDNLGVQRDMFEHIGKWGALIEDGYNAQREVK